jgi:cyclic peptide transporter
MEIFKLLQKKTKLFYFFMILFGMVNGFWSIGLLGIINSSISGTPLPIAEGYNWQLFLGLALLSLFSNKYFRNYMIRLTNDLSYEMGISVVDKLRFATFFDYQGLGKEKVYTALQDAQQISIIPKTFIESFQSLVIVVCCFFYLFWISALGAIILIAFTALIIVFFIYRNKKIESDFNVVRDLHNSYFTYLNDLLLGFKEIKMGSKRNDNLFHKFIDKNRSKAKDLVTKNQIKYVNNDLVGSYSFYMIIAIVLFILPTFYNLNRAQMSTFMVTMLYAMGPVTVLINLIPIYTNVKIAMERLKHFEETLDALKTDKLRSINPLKNIDKDAGFKSIRFEEVTYQYYDEAGRKSFLLGPVNLEIRKGELVFISGGNGSGKSTLINLLTGLYTPSSGKIYYNDQVISQENYSWYRNQVSAIFADGYLFDENYDEFDLDMVNKEFKEYLDIMQLTNLVQVNKEKNKIEKKLSKGQSKRLAMIYLQMENRDICVLDEWAAEQDPEFRQYFYQHLLKLLKDKGNTIVLITHDDKYFDCAERIIKLEYGKIVSDKNSMVVS